jgi:hypothetical protein
MAKEIELRVKVMARDDKDPDLVAYIVATALDELNEVTVRSVELA